MLEAANITKKFADFGIAAVHYSDSDHHIESVELHRVLNDGTVTYDGWLPREQVINAIERGTRFVTLPPSPGGFYRGAPVKVVVIRGRKYIKTESDYTEADNLGSLPRK